MVEDVCPRCFSTLEEALIPYVMEDKVGEPVHGMVEEFVCPTCGYRRPKAEPPAQVEDDSEVCPECGTGLVWTEEEREVGFQCLVVTVHKCPACGWVED